MCLCPPPDMEMPQVAAGCGPNQQQDPSEGKFKSVVFTSITQHATEANYTHIIICQLKIVLPPPNSPANAPGASTGPDMHRRRSPPCVWQPCWAYSGHLLANWAAMTPGDAGLHCCPRLLADMAADRTPPCLHLHPRSNTPRRPDPVLQRSET